MNVHFLMLKQYEEVVQGISQFLESDDSLDYSEIDGLVEFF